MSGRGWGRVAFSAVGVAVGLTVLIGGLGASAMVPRLAGAGWEPPYSLDVRPSAYLVISMAALAILAGTGGLAAGLVAVRRGWDARGLSAFGALSAVVLGFLPPSGSSDHLSYAAYGRIAVLGLDPYAVPPEGVPGDPVTADVEEWRGTTSVYGPVATAVQALASLVGGDSVRLTVFGLSVANVAAFLGTGWLLRRLWADPERRRRVALLWTANPLLLYHLVAGAHVDVLALVFVVAAVVTFGRLPVVSGALVGLGMAVKLPVGLVSLGIAWALRRDVRRLLAVAGSALVVLVAAYALVGGHALDQVRRASEFVSLAVPWQLVDGRRHGFGLPRDVIRFAWVAVAVLLAWLLLRALPRAYPAGARPAGAPPYGEGAPPDTGEDARSAAARVGLAVVSAWLLAAPYSLPWYDGLGFALLAMVPASGFDGFAVARTGLLSLAYLPAREAGRPPELDWLVTVVRSQVVPWALTALLAGLVWWALARRPRSPSGPAGPPPSAPSRGSRSPSR
ncbi:polyprenol phosphomannose-dependent alpha 1,6 mannosyltransferase MptB [Bailinhaonella thermotolerans]|uniref:polyprenol phosphomannose-dependent alpha 1,6 mannosyltransferase MptB n=1 Tax=Bailinhaonella thermotolerans TaxID=1070861 RepID=UPI001F5BA79E|nr:polyprenol phosphomannose-dependent alpha 1,6 mannosyltransferase MptB [Bailinhaonella thermotolerans]